MCVHGASKAGEAPGVPPGYPHSTKTANRCSLFVSVPKTECCAN